MTKVYISGPISGHHDLNEDAFRDAARRLESEGYDPVVPHDVGPMRHSGECRPVYGDYHDGHDSGCYLAADIVALVACDRLYQLPGWENSKGAQLEAHVAKALGIRLIDDQPKSNNT